MTIAVCLEEDIAYKIKKICFIRFYVEKVMFHYYNSKYFYIKYSQRDHKQNICMTLAKVI